MGSVVQILVTAALSLGFLLSPAGAVQAVLNADFEGGSTGTAPTGWNLYNPSYSFPSCNTVYSFQTCFGWSLIPPTGTGNSSATCLKLDQDWSTQAQGVWQQTGAVFSANSTYVFQLMAKKDFDPTGSYLVMEIGYLNNGGSFASLTGTVVVDYVMDATPAWKQYSIPYTTGSSGPELGKGVVILARNMTYRSGLCIDNVRLFYPKPVAIAESGESTSVSEIGPTSDTYTIVLRHQPAADVTITVDPDSQIAVNHAGAGTPVALTFTGTNWSLPQVVTVTAVADSIQEGYHSARITHAASSSDSEFHQTPIDDLRVIVYEQSFAGHGVFHDMNYSIPEFDISAAGDPHHSLWENRPGYNYIVGMTHPAVSETGAIYLLHHRSAPPPNDEPRNRLKRSLDGGYTWTELSSSQIAMSGLNTLLIGKAFGQEKLFNTGLSRYSPDAAANWYPFSYENGVDPYLSLYGEPPTHLITLPGTNTLFLTTDQINDWPHIGTMLSTDGGINWHHGGNLPGHPTMDQFQLPVTIISPDQHQLLVLAGTHGRYSSEGMYRLSHIWQTLDNQMSVWSNPQTASSAVAGDRAFAFYARDGRLVLGFRDSTTKFIPGVVWVGTFDDLIHGRDGQYRIFCMQRDIDWYGGMVVRRRTPPAPDEFLFFTHNEMVRFTLEEFDAMYEGSCKIHLALDETSGNIARDSFMASKTGPNIFGNVNGAIWTSGRLAGSLSFDGIDDSVSVDPKGWNGLDVGDGSATVSFWLKTANVNQSSTVLSKGSANVAASGWAVFFENGLLHFRVKDTTVGVATICTTLPPDEDWHFVTGIVDRSAQTVRLYIDGVLLGSASIAGVGAVTSPAWLELARSAEGDRYFAGNLDDVRFFDHALSDADRKRYSGLTLSAAGNLLKNGGFEEGTRFTTPQGYPLYWKHFGDNPSWFFTRPPGTGNTSNTCLNLFAGAIGYPTGAGFYQETDGVFAPNAQYRFDLDMVLIRETPSTVAEMWIGYIDGSGSFQSLAYNTYQVLTGTVWNTYSVNYATGLSGAAIGRKIAVRFRNLNHRENLHCDNAVLRGPGLRIDESDHVTAVSEGAIVPDSYTVALNSQPQSVVTLTVDPDPQCQVNGAGGGNPVNLVFTTGNWNTPQTVTVSAENDTISEGFHTSIITHSTASSDIAYQGMARSLVVRIVDDDHEACCIAADCNNNGLSDACEIAQGSAPDLNGNGVPDSCEFCPGDLDRDGDVDLSDFGKLQRCYGMQIVLDCVDTDVTHDGTVDQADATVLLQCITGANQTCNLACAP